MNLDKIRIRRLKRELKEMKIKFHKIRETLFDKIVEIKEDLCKANSKFEEIQKYINKEEFDRFDIIENKEGEKKRNESLKN